MAAQLPGRTDNEIKNYWNTRIKRRQRSGLPVYPPEIQRQSAFHHQHHHHSSSSNLASSLALSLSSSPPLPIPSLSLQKSHFGGPLPSFDPMSFASPIPPLLSHHQSFLPPTSVNRFKHFSDNGVGSVGTFSLPFSSPLTSPLSLFHQNLHTQQQPQQQQQQSLQFNSGNFDLNPPILQPTPFEPDGLLPAASISMKLELPSSQVPDRAAAELGQDDNKNPMTCSASLDRSNSGLLDALLQEAQAMVDSDDFQKEAVSSEPSGGKCGLDGCVEDGIPTGLVLREGGTTWSESACHWDDSGYGRLMGTKMEETMDRINSLDEDLCNQLDIIPTSMPTVSEWYSDSGEMSNGQSGVTDDEIGLEMHQLASSLSVAADHDWTLGSCHWDNMPGIC